MKRREFLGVISVAATWSLVARAQQSDKLRRIGVLIPAASLTDARVQQLRTSLQNLGWSEPRNVRLDYRVAVDVSLMSRYAAELVALTPDVIVAFGTLATMAIQRETSRIPVVFSNVGDPIKSGLVASLARPSGNITGFTNLEASIGGKWVNLLHEVSPAVTRISMLLSPDTASEGARGGLYLEAARSAATLLGLELALDAITDLSGVEDTFKELSRRTAGGVIVNPNIFTDKNRDAIIMAAARYAVPAIFPYRDDAEAGGLMSYGIDRLDLTKRAATYVDRILKGEKPTDLPVQMPTKFELTINLKTAKALGLAVPPTLLARADEVIE